MSNPQNQNADLYPTSSPDRTHALFVDLHEVTGMLQTDQTGRFLQTSSLGNQYMMIMYEFDSNYIHVEPVRSRTGPHLLAAYQNGYNMLCARGFKPQLQRLDNEASGPMLQFLAEHQVDVQLTPPHVHRRNAAERAIRTFKNHFIAGLATTDPTFPLHLWDRLLDQAIQTLNLLRTSRLHPQLSSYAHVHGLFDYNRTPLAPPGIRVLIHEKPSTRGTWAPHAVHGWYLGPAMHHYRCYRVWVRSTGAERITDTLTWLPNVIPMPVPNQDELLYAAATQLTNALLRTTAPDLLPEARAALQTLATIFTNYTTPVVPPALVPNLVPTQPPMGIPPVAPPQPTVPEAPVL
jgi:hypothetical protein